MCVHPLMHRGSSELQHQHQGSNHRHGSHRMQGETQSAKNKSREREKKAESLRNKVVKESGGNYRREIVREGRKRKRE